MFESSDKRERTAAYKTQLKKRSSESATQTIHDNRQDAQIQRKLQHLADNTLQRQEESPVANKTGLPDNLKTGIENLSGHSMDDVKVHYNSGKPSQLQAHAYAQGTDIHVAPGQEQHLPHEAWHVVQQKQGRVKATRQMKEAVGINDDPALEKEADVMGAKAASHAGPPVQNFAYGADVAQPKGVNEGGEIAETFALDTPKGPAQLSIIHGDGFIQAKTQQGDHTYVTQLALKDYLNVANLAKATIVVGLLVESFVTVLNGMHQYKSGSPGAWPTIGIGISKFVRALLFIGGSLIDENGDKKWLKSLATHLSGLARLGEGLTTVLTASAPEKAAKLAFGILKSIRSVGRLIAGFKEPPVWVKYLMDVIHVVEGVLNILIGEGTDNDYVTTVGASKIARSAADTYNDHTKKSTTETASVDGPSTGPTTNTPLISDSGTQTV